MTKTPRIKIGIFDHASGAGAPGGAQLVNACMAEVLSEDYDVELLHGCQYDRAMLSQLFDVDLTQVKLRVLETIPESFNIPGPEPFYKKLFGYYTLSMPYDVFIYSGHSVPPFCRARTGIVYSHFPMEVPFHAYPQDQDDKWRKRGALERCLRSQFYQVLWKARMSKYKLIMVNSSFTASWVQQRYGRNSAVVYPPVKSKTVKVPKEKIIVSVGRFTGQARCKNQHLQIAAFAKLLEKVQETWSLHLVGSCGNSALDLSYLQYLRSLARGLPVKFIVNAPRDELDRSLAAASIFWHTCGLSTDESVHPELAEHFGIATVEAMGAGCVPVVIATGGQREIIEHGVNGYLCDDIDQLIANTERLAGNNEELETVSKRAEIRYARFSKDAFAKTFTGCLESHLAGLTRA